MSLQQKPQWLCEASSVRKLTLKHPTEHPYWIHVFLENLQPGEGRLTLVQGHNAYSAWWDAMGDSLEVFTVKASTQYLITKLAPLVEREINIDEDDIQDRFIKDAKALHDKKLLSDEDFESIKEWAEDLTPFDNSPFDRLREKVWGDNYSLPQCINPEYTALEEMLRTLKHCLKQELEAALV